MRIVGGAQRLLQHSHAARARIAGHRGCTQSRRANRARGAASARRRLRALPADEHALLRTAAFGARAGSSRGQRGAPGARRSTAVYRGFIGENRGPYPGPRLASHRSRRRATVFGDDAVRRASAQPWLRALRRRRPRAAARQQGLHSHRHRSRVATAPCAFDFAGYRRAIHVRMPRSRGTADRPRARARRIGRARGPRRNRNDPACVSRSS